MGLPIYGEDLVVDEALYENTFSKIAQPTTRVWGAAFHEAFLDNPIASIYRMSELENTRAAEGEDFGDLITKERFDEMYGRLGLKWDNRMTWSSAQILADRKVRELQNQTIISGGKGGGVENIGLFGSALIASLMDPVNIAMAFMPIVSAPKYAQLGARYGRIGNFFQRGLIKSPELAKKATEGSMLARIKIGFIEGAAGGAFVEPLTYAARSQEQADYTAIDSLANIILGGVLGSGLHAGTGKLSDIFSARQMKKIEADMRSTEMAYRQMADGNNVDVMPLRTMDDAEIAISDRSLDVDDRQLEAALEIQSLEIGANSPVKVVSEGKEGVTVKFAEDKGNHLTGFGKNLQEARAHLYREHNALMTNFRNNAEKFESTELQGKLERLVTERNRLEDALSQPTTQKQTFESLQQMRERLANLTDSDAMQIKLRELGFPVDMMQELRTRLEAAELRRQNLVGTLPGKKKVRGKARIAQELEDEVAAIRDQLETLIELNEKGKFAKSKELFRRERKTLKTQLAREELGASRPRMQARLKELNKEIKNTRGEIEQNTLKMVQEHLDKQRLPENKLFHTPEPDPQTKAVLDKDVSTELKDIEAEIRELDEALELDLDELPANARADIEAAEEIDKFVDTISDAQKRGVECMAGLLRG